MIKSSQKIILDYQKLVKAIKAHKVLNKKIVCTIGSWDVLHIGHLRYLKKAKELGDILVVGVDSDKAIKTYKHTPLRPIIPQDERIEMLSYQSFVDYITLINDVDKKGRWKMGLIKAIKPNIFVATTGESYPIEQRKEIAKFCGQLKILPRQARNTSTTKIIERTFKKHLKYILNNTKL